MKWEYKHTVLISHFFAWTFVWMDRMVIAIALPAIAIEFKLSLTEAGLLVTVLGVSWAIFSLFGGNLSDRIGRRRVIVPAAVIFSFFTWVSGVAANFVQMLTVRLCVGAPEGTYMAPSTALIAETWPEERRGFALSFHTSGAAVGTLIATFVGGLIVASLGWRWAFYLFAIPGIVIALIIWRFTKEPPSIVARKEKKELPKISWGPVVKNRNIVLINIAMICTLGAWIVFYVFSPIYMENVLKLSVVMTGSLLAITSVTGIVGYVTGGMISDRVGRKPVLLITLFLLIPLYYLFLYSTNPLTIGILFALMGYFLWAPYALIVAVCPAESVPLYLRGTATGIVLFFGEGFAATAPTIAGAVGDIYGLSAVFVLPSVLMLIGFISIIFYRETAPRILARKQKAPTTPQ